MEIEIKRYLNIISGIYVHRAIVPKSYISNIKEIKDKILEGAYIREVHHMGYEIRIRYIKHKDVVITSEEVYYRMHTIDYYDKGKKLTIIQADRLGLI